MNSRLVVFALLILGGTISRPGWAQVQLNSSAREITLAGRVQTQFNSTSVLGEPGSDLLIRRARLEADVVLSDFVSGRFMLDVAPGAVGLRDGWLRLHFSPAFRVTFGQFKRPFDIFELTSSTQTLVVERDGDIRGVTGCGDLGDVCSLSLLTEDLGFSDRDIGAMIDGQSGNVTYAFSITNGTGLNSRDENGTKSYTGRVGVSPSEQLHLALNLGFHDFPNPVIGDDDAAIAFGGDIELGDFSEGLHVQTGVVAGQNWQTLDAGGNPSTFATGQIITSYRQPIPNNDRVSGIEPLARLSIADPDLDQDEDGGILVTPGLMIHFVGRNKIAANLDIWIPQTGDPEWSLKFQSYLRF